MEQEQEQFSQRTDLSVLNDAVAQIRSVLSNIIIGQKQVIDFLIVGLLADGHILIEGVPV